MANVILTPEITDILGRSTITENKLVLPPGQLDRKMYEAVNKALVAAGGKWNTKARAHIFTGDPKAKLGLALETGTVVDEKKKFQTFFTPVAIADQVAELAEVEGHVVLEPSAGKGALAEACMRAGARRVECVELNPENVETLGEKGFSAIEADFLLSKPNRYARIVMNPPFTKNQDIKHVAHALRFLDSGGILVSIMMPNIERPKFQELIRDRRYEIVNVPAGAFKESGTTIATIILKIFN